MRRQVSLAIPSIDPGARRRLTARFGTEVAPWFDELPGLLSAVARQWHIELGAPIPRGSVSVVVRCRLADGQRAVLKASPDRARLRFEAAALDVWQTVHSPAVIAFDEVLGVLLMEAIEPGEPLVVSAAYPAVESFAELLGALHDDARDLVCPPVEQRVHNLYDSSAGLYERHREVSRLVPPGLYERGRALATRLAQHRLPAVLLHGDLTPSNVLDGGPGRGLVAVDPAPCIGDAAFDVVDMILWQADDLVTIEARAERLAAVTGIEMHRMLAWCAAFAAMTALDIASEGDALSGRMVTLLELASQSL